LNRNAERAPEHIKASNLDVNKAKPELSRREREELDKQRRKQQYMEAYAAGRTPEAQADLARLQRIRREREAAAKRKEEEAQAKEEAKKTAREKSQGRKASTYL
jgi:peptidoglycan hydrolase CwlO-like protein